MTVKIIRGAGRSWRPFRFPPRSGSAVAAAAGDFAGDAAALQRAVAEGFEQGMDRGYQEGLQQGREAGRQEGFEHGRQEGLRQGLEEGRTRGLAQFEQSSRALERVIEQFHEFQRELEAARREELLELVKKVAKQVIRCELTLHPTQLMALAEEALAAMPGGEEDVRILLNPEECARIKELAPERAAAWRLVPDERLALGECRVITAHAEADIGCQQRLEACMETLASHLKTVGA
jgi:Flagellar biosynthesis/type III secretory pathway protein